MSTRATRATEIEDEAIEPVIRTVGIVDENDDLIVTDTTQYVNLPKEDFDKFSDASAGITHSGILGRKLKFLVRFNVQGNHKFKIKLLPATSNQSYSPDEKRRNENFRLDYQNTAPTEFTTDNSSEKIVECDTWLVSPAGGDKFKIQATDDNNNTVRSMDITTERLVYYLEIKPAALTNIAANLNTFTSEFAKHGVTFRALPEVTIPETFAPRIRVVDYNRTPQRSMIALIGYVDSLFNPFDESDEGKERNNKKDYCVAVVYVEHLAIKGANKRVPKPNVRRSSTPENVIIRDPNTRIPYSLWHNIGSRDSWFVSCQFEYDTDGVSNPPIPIPIEKCTPKEAAGRTGTGECNSVDIDVSGLPRNVTGKIVLTVNWVEDMIAGFAISGTNVTAVATKAWWNATNAQQQTAIAIHEAGHWLGMVPDGDAVNNKPVPDKTPNFYTEKGHQGPHCSSGLNDTEKAMSDYTQIDPLRSDCIMYGEMNNRSAFCNDCAIALKKMDLSR
jgi:hypothetical protein